MGSQRIGVWKKGEEELMSRIEQKVCTKKRYGVSIYACMCHQMVVADGRQPIGLMLEMVARQSRGCYEGHVAGKAETGTSACSMRAALNW